MNAYAYKIFRYLINAKKGYPLSPLVVLGRLMESQYWPDDKLAAYQLERLNELLFKAVETSEYYRERIRKSDLPVKSLEEFDELIPCLPKEVMKKQIHRLKTKYYTTDYRHISSGTTGDPITVYTSALADVYREAGSMRFLSWWNVKPQEANIYLWGKRVAQKKENGFKEGLKSLIRNRYDLDAFNLTPRTIKDYYAVLCRVKPRYIRGYKSAILSLAELMEENRLKADKIGLKLAVATAEVLFENEREFIEKVLQCPVANEYGGSDLGQVGFECPHGSMHVFEEAAYIGVTDRNEIIATELYNDSMPMIKYINNDRIILSPNKCSCGRNSRIISEVVGRNEDMVIKQNGERVTPMLFIYMVNELDTVGLGGTIHKWKMIQNKNSFRMIVVPGEGYSERVEEYLRKRIRQEIGNDSIVEFCITGSIPKEKSGKMRLFVRMD